MEASEKASVASGKAPRRVIFTFCDLLRDVRDEKRNRNCGPQMNFTTLPQKFSYFSQLHLFLFVGPAKPLWSSAPV